MNSFFFFISENWSATVEEGLWISVFNICLGTCSIFPRNIVILSFYQRNFIWNRSFFLEGELLIICVICRSQSFFRIFILFRWRIWWTVFGILGTLLLIFLLFFLAWFAKLIRAINIQYKIMIRNRILWYIFFYFYVPFADFWSKMYNFLFVFYKFFGGKEISFLLLLVFYNIHKEN